MKNAYIASRPGSVPADRRGNADTVLAETGQNTGNLLFFSAVRRVVAHERPSVSMSFDPRTVREHHDGIVIPAANWLNSTSDFGGLADLVEASGLPCVVLGLGAQSQSSEKIPALTEGTRRFLSVVSHSAATISVRGDYTAEVLSGYGIRNVEVTGCPSLLWHVDRPASIDDLSGSIASVALNGTRSDNDPGLLKANSPYAIGLLVLRHGFRNSIDYVLQTERSEMQIVAGEAGDLSDEAVGRLKKIYMSEDFPGILDYARKHLKFFTDVESWISYLSGKDLTVGTRLHGAIAAVLAGRRAVLMTHDTRTLEMAGLAGIPSVPAQEILSSGTLDLDRLNRVSFDAFNSRQREYYLNFSRFLSRNDVGNHLSWRG